MSPFTADATDLEFLFCDRFAPALPSDVRQWLSTPRGLPAWGPRICPAVSWPFCFWGYAPTGAQPQSFKDSLDRKGIAASSHRGGEAVAEIEFTISTSPSAIN
jgi:hypothetical protein